MAETATVGRAAVSAETAATDRTAWTTTGLGLPGAFAMASCCILPLVLVSLGVTGVFIAQLGALSRYRWLTLTLSAAFLGYGFWKAYRPIPVIFPYVTLDILTF